MLKSEKKLWVVLSLFISLIFALCPMPAKADIGDIIYSFASPCSYPVGLVFDGTYLWHADDSCDTIYCLDPQDGTVIRSFGSPGPYPRGLTWGGAHLWVADPVHDKIYKIDPTTGEWVHWIPTPAGASRGLCWDGGNLWVVDGATRTLYQIETDLGDIIYSISIGHITDYPRGLSPAPDGEMYMVDGLADRIAKFNPYSGDVSMEILTPYGNPWGVAWNGQHLFLGDNVEDRIYLLSLSPALGAELSLNQDAFGPGDELRATVRLTNDDTPDDVMVKLWLTKPDQSVYTLYDIPLLRVDANVDFEVSVLTYTFSGEWSTGDYLLGVRFLDPKTGAAMAYSGSPFAFSPGP